MSVRRQDESVFPPMSREDMDRRGWDAVDVLIVTGDAYVDHPSFGAAVIVRVLEAAGYRVGVIAQPDWTRPEAFAALGRPRLFVGITAGNMDSMVANYTGNRLPRSEDAYSPGGAPGRRPNRAVVAYAQRVRQALGDVPIVLGGVEASLRRLAHYDYWQDAVRRSVLVDAQADLIAYGMAERAAVQIARRLAAGEPIGQLTDIAGTVLGHPVPGPQGAGLGKDGAVVLPSFEEVRGDAEAFNEAFRLWWTEQDPFTARPVVQRHGRRWVIQNPPPMPMTTGELDAVFALPFTRRAHPIYDAAGGVPALETVRTSITSHRGCFGRCSFCAIGAHQGHHVTSRRTASIVAEAERIAAEPGFGGTISDVGGPTANMYGMRCSRTAGQPCRRDHCLEPAPCPRLTVDHWPQVAILDRVSRVRGIKHVFLSTGLRHDLLLADPNCDEVLAALCRRHVSGQLRVAPEHAVDGVLRWMGKPPFGRFLDFLERFQRINRALRLEQYLACYFISAHPGATLADAVALAEAIRDHRLTGEQVQDFTPTPMTRSAAMYHTGRDPLTGRALHVARKAGERARQRAVVQFRNPKNRRTVANVLRDLGRSDLLTGPRALVPRKSGDSTGRSVPRLVSSGRAVRDSRKDPAGQGPGGPHRRGHTIDRNPGMLSPDSRHGKRKDAQKTRRKRPGRN